MTRMTSETTAPAQARTLILGTAGHIDHGKTALVRALTGIDTDRLPAEKQRGITIDIGFATLDVGSYRLGVVDVPGHERFVKNMLAGAVGVDLALLVVAADDSIMPQTREHLAIMRLLDVRHGVVAITKCDRVEPDWAELVEEELRRLVAGTFLEDAPVVRTAISDEAQQGIEQLRDALHDVCRRVAPSDDQSVFRMPIDRAFTVEGRGTVVTGTVWSGTLRVRDEVDWWPAGKKLAIRGLQNHGQDSDMVGRGQRAAVNLLGVHHSEITRGHEIATPTYLRPSKLLTVELHVLDDSPRAIRHRSRQRLYLGTQEVMVTVATLDRKPIEPGGRSRAQLHCATPTVSASGQPFVVRSESPLVTIGGGVVLQPCPGRITPRQPQQIERLAGLLSDDEVERAQTAIYFFATGDWTELDLCRDARLDLEQCSTAIRTLESSGTIVALDVKPRRTLRLHRDVVQREEQRVLKIVEQLHNQSTLKTTVPRDRVIALHAVEGDTNVSDALIDRLAEGGALVGDQQSMALPGYAPELSAGQRQLHERILAVLQESGLQPPGPAEMAKTYGAREDEVRRLLEYCVACGEAVRLDDKLYLHRDVETAMRDQLRTRLADGSGMTVSQIRDVLGTSRKFAVPICEHLDRIGMTQRQGDLRVLR